MYTLIQIQKFFFDLWWSFICNWENIHKNNAKCARKLMYVKIQNMYAIVQFQKNVQCILCQEYLAVLGSNSEEFIGKWDM